MTSSGGTSRPTAPEVHDDTQTDVDHAREEAGNGTSESSDKRGVASSAYEVAAALRARASRSSRSDQEAAPPPPPSNGTSSPSGSAPDVDIRKDPVTSDDNHRDLAGAPEATTPPTPTIEQPRQAPVPPPSMVAEQQRAAASLAPPIAPPDPSGGVDMVDMGGAYNPAPPQSPKKTTQRRPARMPTPRRTVRVRKARLRLMRVDPWSVMKTAFLLSVALGITLFVAVTVLWAVLDSAGVFDSVRDIVTQFTATDSSTGVDINEYIELSRVLGFTTLIAVVDVVLVTALATLGAFLYNLSASLLGGLEVTLAEDD